MSKAIIVSFTKSVSSLDYSVDDTITCFQKEKRRKWVFGRLKSKRFPLIEAPPPLKETRLSEAEEEHNRHALTVAIASAEAALTAAQIAVEVVKFQSVHQCKGKLEEVKDDASISTHKCKKKIEESAAIKVQTAFRGYLVSFRFLFCFSLNSFPQFFSKLPLIRLRK